MRTATSRFVNIFNVSVVVSACLFGLISGLIGHKYTEKINKNLNNVSSMNVTNYRRIKIHIQNQADDELVMFNDQKKEKKRNIILVSVVLLTMTMMVILDCIGKWRSADKFRESCNFHKRISIWWGKKLIFGILAEDVIEIESSLPFYLLYYILMALQIQLAQAALGIRRRYLRLNSAIRNMFSMSKIG